MVSSRRVAVAVAGLLAASDGARKRSSARSSHAKALPNPAKVWLTKVGSDALPESLLEQQADVAFRPADGAVLEDITRGSSDSAAAGSALGGTLECRKDITGHPTRDCRVVKPELPVSLADRARTGAREVVQVNVAPDDRLQDMDGFGAAMTHASAHLLAELKLSRPSLYRELMGRLFGNATGSARLSSLRVPIGSSDFAVRKETFADAPAIPGCKRSKACAVSCSMPGGACSKVVPKGEWVGMADNCNDAPGCGDNCWNCTECSNCCCVPADWSLATFGPRMSDVIEVLQDAKALVPELMLMGSPWSPPAWLKEHGMLEAITDENTLIDDELTYTTYAEYLAEVAELFYRKGLPFAYMTLQNEPLFGTSKYPGMYLSAKNGARLGKEVQKKLQARDIPAVKLLAYDHNWDVPDYPLTQLSEAPGVFAGVAWHCYGGSMSEAQDKFYQAHPEAEQHFTECTGSFPDNKCDISMGMDSFGWHHNWDMTNILLGSVAKGSRSSAKWIMVLDEDCGPTLPGVDFQWGRPFISMPRNASSMADVSFNQDFWSMAHMSRFIRPGARRVRSSKVGDSDSIIEAFRDDQAGTLTLIAVNLDRDRDQPLKVISGEGLLEYTLPKWGTVVLVWDLAA